MTPEEKAVIEAAKVIAADLADQDPDHLDMNERELLTTVRALEPPKPEPDAEAIEAVVEAMALANTPDAWSQGAPQIVPLYHFASAALGKLREVGWRPASEVVDKELARRLANNLAGYCAAHHIAADPNDGVHPGAWASCPAEDCTDIRELIAEARAQIGGAA